MALDVVALDVVAVDVVALDVVALDFVAVDIMAFDMKALDIEALSFAYDLKLFHPIRMTYWCVANAVYTHVHTRTYMYN